MGIIAKRLLALLFLLLSFLAQGQTYFDIELIPPSNSELKEELMKFAGPLKDTVDLTNRLNAVKIILYERAFLLSSAELYIKDTMALLKITPSSEVFSGDIELTLPPGFALPLNRDLKYDQGPVNGVRFKALIEQYLGYLENHGYPFAQLTPAEYKLRNDSLHLNLSIQPGPLVSIDSLVIKGFNRFSRNVIKHNLKYRPGMLYREQYLQELIRYVDQIEYLKMSRPPAVAFTKSKTILYLYLEEVKGNQIDGVVGLNTEEDGKVILNGDLQLRLLHVFKKGEEIKIRWRSPDESVQSLNFDFELPYLFKSPFWLEGNLAIFRQDSSFVNSDAQGLVKFLFESGSFISGGISYRSSNVLLSNEASSTFKSFNTASYKLGLELNKTNRIIVPTRGFAFSGYGISGKRKSTDDNQDQYGWQISADQWIPIFPRHIIKISLKTQALFGGNLFTNELYRLGGLKTLRGFNEQSIYSSRYGIGTLEYRFMIGNYDYLTLFTDIAYTENNSGDQFTSDLLTGIGAGINFQTRAGIFSLFYALGKDESNPFDLRTSKIHFGYINRF